MKKMAVLFLILGVLSLALSYYFYTKKEIPPADFSAVNKQKGNDFEDYLIQLLGKTEGIQLVGKVSDYHKDGVSALENTEPDLKFKTQNAHFAVECKWRSSFKNGNINWAKDYQIKNYNTYQKTKNEKVFVALGIGGTSTQPERLFFVPLYRLKLEFANEDYIKEFEIKDQRDLLKILRNTL
jgi:hypothetical protein